MQLAVEETIRVQLFFRNRALLMATVFLAQHMQLNPMWAAGLSDVPGSGPLSPANLRLLPAIALSAVNGRRPGKMV